MINIFQRNNTFLLKQLLFILKQNKNINTSLQRKNDDKWVLQVL